MNNQGFMAHLMHGTWLRHDVRHGVVRPSTLLPVMQTSKVVTNQGTAWHVTWHLWQMHVEPPHMQV